MKKNSASIVKITRPNISGVFPRKSLMRLLDETRKQQAVWISGPAGSGKTTLAASYLDARKLPCLWYQVDEGDGDIASFFYYMGLAAHQAAPRYRTPLPLLTPEYLPGISTFVRRFFEDLYRRLKPPFALVFDNYQDVSAESPIHSIVNSLLSLAPPGIQVFVLSRKEPLPVFARLRANGAMRVVGWDDLRFTLEESKQIIRLKLKRNLSEETLSELYERTQGWAAGLMLILEGAGAKKQDAPGSASPGHEEIFDYFAGEVFEKLDRETRTFLLMTAFLPRMTVQTAEKLTNQANAGRILATLNRNHFFTEKHLSAEPVYQYHPLFREFLLTRVKAAFGPEDLLQLQQHAARLLEEAGHVEDAFLLLRDARAWKELVGLTLGRAQLFMSQGRSATLSEWIESLPQEITDRTAWLLYWKGVCKLPYSPPDSRLILERAFRLFEDGGDQVGVFLAWSSIVQTFMVEIDDFRPLDRWISWLDERDRRGISFPSPEIEAMTAAGMIGALRWRMPNHPHIKKWVESSLSVSQKGLNVNTYLRACINCEYYYFWMGEFADCSLLINQMERVIGSQPAASPLMVTMLKTLEALLYNTSVEANRTAVQSASEGIETAQRTGVHLMDPLLHVMRVISALNDADTEQAGKYLAQAETAVGNDRRADSFPCAFLSVWYNLFAGNLQQTLALANKAVLLAEKIGSPIYDSLIRLVSAQALYESADSPGALKQLAAAKNSIQQTGSTFFEYLYHLTAAYIAFEQKDDHAGLEALRKAMTWGRRKEYASAAFFWRPAAWSLLCSKALEAGIEVEYVQNLVRKLIVVPDRRSPVPENWPWPLKIYTLGRFELIRDGEPVLFSGKVQQKPLALLKALIALGGNDVPEERFTDSLWPDADGDLAHKSFEMTLQRLRRLIGNDNIILLHERRLTLDPALCRVDVWALEDLLTNADRAWKHAVQSPEVQDEAVRTSNGAIDLYRGHFLPGESGHAWILPYRERLRSKFLRTVSRLGEHRERTMQWKEAAEVFQKGLEADSLTEEFYQQLMVCYQQLGLRAEAIAVYHRCRSLLSSSLGISPSPRTEELYQSLRGRS